jgi:hypothetical protein
MSINAQPFSPSFKLVDNLQDGQVLIYDVNENAFVNAYGDGSGANTTPITTVMNLGTGISLSDGATGNALELKTLVAGSGITISDNTTNIVISANQVDQIQSATNVGNGAGVLSNIVNNNFEFKSISAGNGIGIVDNGSTITLSIDGSIGSGTYLSIANNLNDLSDKAAARTNLNVYSKSEVQGKFIRLDGHSVPDMDKVWDIGSPLRRFQDVYGETFQGTAVLANNLTISGNIGDVLTWNGSSWVAAEPTSGGSGGGTSIPQSLSLNGLTLTISGGNSVTLPSIPSDISQLSDTGGLLNHFSGSYDDLTNKPTLFSGSYNDLTNKPTLFDGQYASLTGKPSIPTDVSELTDTTNLLGSGGGSTDLTNYYTKAEVDGLIPTTFSGDYNDLTNTPAIPSITGLASELYVDNELSNSLSLYATQAYVDGRFTDLLGAAPEALDTLKELSDALGGDANFSTTITNQLSAKANTADLATVATTGSYNDLTDTPTLFDGAYSSLTGTPTIPTDVSDLTDTTNLLSGGPHYTDADVATYLNGNINTHLIPDTNVAYDLGSAENKFRDLYLSSATIYLDTDTLSRSTEGNLMWNGNDVQDWTHIKNKPDISELTNNHSNRAVKMDDLQGYYTTAQVDTLLANVASGGTVDLSGYATQAYVNGQGFITTSALSGYATQAYVNGQGFITDADISGFLTSADLSGYATQAYVNGQGFLKSADLSGYATTSQLNNYATTAQLSDYATETWVTSTFATPFLVNSIISTKDLSDFSDTNNIIPTDISELTDTTNLLTGGTPHFSGDYNDLTNKPVIPSDISNLTDTTGLLNSNAFSGSWNDLSDKPTIPTDISNLTDINGIIAAANTDAQTLSLDGNNITISGGNTIDLSSIAGSITLTGGTGIDITGQTVSLDASLGDLQDVSNAAAINGQVLTWNGASWAPANSASADLASSSINDLNDVDTTGIQNGYFLSWNGTKFVATTASTVDISTESITDLSDVTTDTPNNGDVLTWNGSAYAPLAPSGGGGGSGSSVEYFKLNYATNGDLTSITNTTTGVSATILSSTGGDVQITFSGYNFPPSNVLLYGYAYSSNQYVIMPLNKDITTRTVAGGGSAGSPIAFGSFGSTSMTLKLREADTGSSRSFGTTTHAWIVFSMIN